MLIWVKKNNIICQEVNTVEIFTIAQIKAWSCITNKY